VFFKEWVLCLPSWHLSARTARFEAYAGRYVWRCHILEHEGTVISRPFLRTALVEYGNSRILVIPSACDKRKACDIASAIQTGPWEKDIRLLYR
jgi:hypothetical protein